MPKTTTATCPHCGAPEDREYPFMFLCGSSTRAVRRSWACQRIERLNRGIATVASLTVNLHATMEEMEWIR